MMKTYDKYKESYNIWLGNIPEHWTISSLKHFVEIISGYAFKSEDYSDDQGVPIIRIGDISNSVDVYNAKKAKPKNLEELDRFIIKRGDLLLAMTGATIGKNCMYETDEISYVNQRVGLLRGKNSLTQSYLKYFIDTTLFREFISLTCSGSAQENISTSQVGGLQFPLPSIEEQTKITQYLDHQTAIIDQLIQQKEKLIELLKEKRQAVINEAVTKGLDPNAKMKNSGIEWLGEVPEHWSVTRLSRLSNVIDPQPDHRAPLMDDNGLPYLGIRDINDDGTINTETARIVELAAIEKQERSFKIKDGDIVFGKVGSLAEPKHILLGGERVALSATLVLIQTDNKIVSRFLKYFLDSSFIWDQINTVIVGATRPALGIQQIRKFVILFPPLPEVEEVVDYLDIVTKRINHLIESHSMIIDKIKEYRQSIISEAVTGKIDVREWQPNKQEVA